MIICGSYRSGTTWLMEILSAGLNHQFDFEPLEPSVHPAVRAAKLRNRYLSPDRTYEALDPILERIIRGRIIHPYTKGMGHHPFSYRRWKFWARRHVIKLVQGHMLLGYIQKRFHFPGIVLLVRHPFGVVSSLKRLDWWRSDLEEFLDERSGDLFADYPELREYVRQAADLLDAAPGSDLRRKVGRTAIRYCMENYVPIRQHLNKQCSYRILRYEDLRNDPVGRASELCQQLGIPFTRRHRRQTGKRSRTSSPGLPPSGPAHDDPPGLPEEERELISRILRIFKLETFLDEFS
jgi:hypothetical protein